jgi:hypothetical protein
MRVLIPFSPEKLMSPPSCVTRFSMILKPKPFSPTGAGNFIRFDQSEFADNGAADLSKEGIVYGPSIVLEGGKVPAPHRSSWLRSEH